MLRLITLLSPLFFAVNIYACPNMSGKYLCKAAGAKDQSLVIKQDGNSITISDGKKSDISTYLLDGKKNQFTNKGKNSEIIVKYTGLCSGDKITIDIDLGGPKGTIVTYFYAFEKIKDGVTWENTINKMDFAKVKMECKKEA